MCLSTTDIVAFYAVRLSCFNTLLSLCRDRKSDEGSSRRHSQQEPQQQQAQQPQQPSQQQQSNGLTADQQAEAHKQKREAEQVRCCIAGVAGLVSLQLAAHHPHAPHSANSFLGSCAGRCLPKSMHGFSGCFTPLSSCCRLLK